MPVSVCRHCRVLDVCMQAAGTRFPFAYNTLMAINGFNNQSRRGLTDEIHRMLLDFSLYSHDRSFNPVEACDERDEIHFRQIKDGVDGLCIVCNKDQSSGPGHWHTYDVLSGELID